MKETILINWYFFEVLYTQFCLKFFDDKLVYGPVVFNEAKTLDKKWENILAFFDELEKALQWFGPLVRNDKIKDDKIVTPPLNSNNPTNNLRLITIYKNISNTYFKFVNQQLNTFNFHFKLFIYKFGFT